MEYRLNTKRPNLICLILLISFPSFASVLIAPALPAISNYFGVSEGYSQQLITVFLIGYTFGQLMYSPFANKFGRKIALFWGISIYLVGSLICLIGAHTHLLNLILIGRGLSGLGSAAGMVLIYTIISDFYHPHQGRSILGYTVIAYAFMPSVAILAGGFLTTYISWIACFYFLLFYGILMYIAAFILPETMQTQDHSALKVKSIFSNYFRAFKSWRIIVFSILLGLCGAFVYVTSTASPFIAIKTLGIKASLYGVLFLIPYSGQLVGGFSAGKLNSIFSTYKMIRLAFLFLILGTLFIFISFILHWINLFTLLAPLFFIFLSIPILTSNASIMALSDYVDKATAAAIMSFTMMVFVTISIIILTLLPTDKTIVMPSFFLGLLILSLLVFWHVQIRFEDQAPHK